MRATKALQLGTGDIQRLRRKKGVDEEIGDAVAANESDGIVEFGSLEVPVSPPVGVVKTLHEGAESFRPALPHSLS